MRTTVDLDPDLLKRLRAEAHRRRIPFKALLNRALRRGLEGAPRARAKPLPLATFAMGKPLRSLDKALALADTLEDEERARKLVLRQ